MTGLSKATTRRMYGLHMHKAEQFSTFERDTKRQPHRDFFIGAFNACLAGLVIWVLLIAWLGGAS